MSLNYQLYLIFNFKFYKLASLRDCSITMNSNNLIYLFLINRKFGTFLANILCCIVTMTFKLVHIFKNVPKKTCLDVYKTFML